MLVMYLYIWGRKTLDSPDVPGHEMPTLYQPDEALKDDWRLIVRYGMRLGPT